MATVIQTCTCQSEYQDKQYGHGKRVWNETTKPPGYRCTVCGKEKPK